LGEGQGARPQGRTAGRPVSAASYLDLGRDESLDSRYRNICFVQRNDRTDPLSERLTCGGQVTAMSR